jgi:hypothetical protein
MTNESTPEAPQPDAPPPASVPSAPSRARIVLPLAFGVVLGAAAAAGGYWFHERTQTATNGAAAGALNDALAQLDRRAAADIAALRTDLGRLADRVSAIEGSRVAVADFTTLRDQVRALADRPAGSPAGATDAAATARAEDLAAAFAELRTAVAALQSRAAADPAAIADAAAAANTARSQVEALSRQLAAQQARLQAVEVRERAPDSTTLRAGMVIAATQLRERMARAGSFAAELEAFRATVGDTQDAVLSDTLQRLQPIAARGAPTADALRQRLARDGVVALAAAESAPQTWTDTVRRTLRGLVRVRRTGEEQPATDAGRLTRAEELLAQDDVAGAVAQVQSLAPSASSVLADWLADAQARLTVDAAGATIPARAVTLVMAQP